MHTYHRRTLLTTTAASMMAYLLYNWGQPLVRHAVRLAPRLPGRVIEVRLGAASTSDRRA